MSATNVNETTPVVEAPVVAETAPATTEEVVAEQPAPEAEKKSTNDKIVENENAAKANDALSPGFNTNIFGCFEDIVGCALACCLPCIPAAANRANVEERDVQWADFICCPNNYQTRQTMRNKYGMEVAPWNDCVGDWCCGACSLHQNTREIANRTGKAAEYIKLPVA